ncbi:hypothetical protein ACHAXT_004349 [Thalassiosira profunda]
MRSPLILVALISLLGSLCAPAVAFRAPSIAIATQRHARAPIRHTPAARTVTPLRSSQDGYPPNNNSQEREMMDQIQNEQVEREQMDQLEASQPRVDPLIASLTRIDEPVPDNVPMVQAPLIGEIPADGSLALLVPAAAISVLGFIFSIVVAFNSRDEIVREVGQVKIPEMKYTPTVVEEGKCRGLCSSQDQDLDGLRNFMEGLRKD